MQACVSCMEAAQHLLHAARQRLREREKAFTEHLGEEDTSLWVERIAGAEREVAEARARVKALSAGWCRVIAAFPASREVYDETEHANGVPWASLRT